MLCCELLNEDDLKDSCLVMEVDSEDCDDVKLDAVAAAFFCLGSVASLSAA